MIKIVLNFIVYYLINLIYINKYLNEYIRVVV